jgi:hypothetical protein
MPLRNTKNRKTIIVACHDAGGAEIVSAYVLKHRMRSRFVLYAAGPAGAVFERKKLRYAAVKGIGHAAQEARRAFDDHPDASLLLTGTSAAGSPFETAFMREAKLRGMRTASYLEHWVNYRERFGYPAPGWRRDLPDEIWVGDRAAEKLARSLFPPKAVRIRSVPNLYFADIRKRFRALRGKGSRARAALFLSDPTGYERAALESLLRLLVERKFKGEVIVRLHPVEPLGKYADLFERYRDILELKESKGGDILADIVRSRVVIGGRSNALVLAALCGKRTVSVIPAGSKDAPLPFEGIRNVRGLKAADIFDL